MVTVTRRLNASPAQVWEVLADGWLYPLWVVGASRMREVDDEWPQPGARLHHSVGAWPMLLDDYTEAVEVEPASVLGLHARAWPTGAASVTLRLHAVGRETEVAITEDVVRGPGLLVPRPLRHAALRWRNVETLRRLAYVAERRSAA